MINVNCDKEGKSVLADGSTNWIRSGGVEKMDKRRLTKLSVQAVATAFGLLGLLWTGMGLYFAVISIRDSDRFGLLFMTPMFILLGGIALAVAWQNLRRFGPNSIRNVTFLVVYTLYSILPALVVSHQEAVPKLKKPLFDLATFLIPLILAYMLYSFVSRKLIQITETKNIQQDASAVGGNH